MSNVPRETESGDRNHKIPASITQVRYIFHAPRPARARKIIPTTSSPMPPELPRITRLIALAIHLEKILQQSPGLDRAELARRGCVSQTRITQILNLLYLAPDIQEQLLWLVPLKRGREVITENRLRRLAWSPTGSASASGSRNCCPGERPLAAKLRKPAKLSPVRFVQNDLAGRRESAAFLLARADAAPLKPRRRP